MCWEPAAEHLRSDGQQVGDEVVRVEEGVDEREGETEGDRTLDHPPLLKLQVSICKSQPAIKSEYCYPTCTDSKAFAISCLCVSLSKNFLKVLLGPVHAATVGGEPDHLAGRHLLLQR